MHFFDSSFEQICWFFLGRWDTSTRFFAFLVACVSQGIRLHSRNIFWPSAILTFYSSCSGVFDLEICFDKVCVASACIQWIYQFFTVLITEKFSERIRGVLGLHDALLICDFLSVVAVCSGLWLVFLTLWKPCQELIIFFVINIMKLIMLLKIHHIPGCPLRFVLLNLHGQLLTTLCYAVYHRIFFRVN